MTPLTFCLALAACVALGFIIIVSPDIHRAIRKRKARRLHERAMAMRERLLNLGEQLAAAARDGDDAA